MSELQKIVVGIRSSNLSKSQTNLLIQELLKQDSNLNKDIFNIKTIKTTGDVHNTHRLDQIGGKGLFIKEIEEQIMSGKIDIGVHSMKDVPAQDTYPDIDIICWMQRHKTNDAMISNSGKSFMDLPAGSVIGTSSIRRRSQVLNLRKDLSIKLLRGNVDTRIQKLRNHEYDAIILSLAGLSRLNLDHLVTEVLGHNLFLPAACQGAVGVQALKKSEIKNIFAPINDLKTQTECIAERKVLKNINANCNSPVSIYASINKNNISLKFEMFDHQGNKIFKKSKEDLKENYLTLCDELGKEILDVIGQTKINELDNLKSDFNYTP
jgi:hydroxymethylbilane synthase